MRPQRLHSLLIPALLFAVVVALPRPADAQRRGPVVRHRVVVYGGFYSPAFFRPWYPYSFGYPWYPYQFGYPPYGYYGRWDELTSSVRLEVTPSNTEVYVDGYRAGTVDSYDGFFQRLRLRPGEHELTLYLDGYRTVRQRLYLNSGADQKIRYTMVPLAPGEQPEPRPQPPIATEQAGVMPAPARPGPRGIGPGRGGPGRGLPPGRPAPGGPPPAAGFGSVSVRVQPEDAEILIDGERWTGPAGQERLVVQLSGGRHRVEVRKDGYERYSSEVDVQPGETVTLNISLLRRESSW